MAATNKKPPQTTGGSGYGGSDADKQKRNKGKKEAQKREKGTWADWQAELKGVLERRQVLHDDNANDNDNSSTTNIPVLNTLKQVLRCQAPDWWWRQPQRKMYILALEVSILLTSQHPRAWGDPDDTESAMAALEELAQTSDLLISSSSSEASIERKNNNTQHRRAGSGPIDTANNNHNKGTAMETSKWLREQLTKAPKHKNTNDMDLMLPRCVLKIRKEASIALQLVLEAPACSAMGAHEHYRQKMRPLAFGIIGDGKASSFEHPRHYYAQGGGYERTAEGARQRRGQASASSSKRGKNSVKGTTASSSAAASAMALWKELSTYPTALPIEYGSSIFVRALESELDKLRVLIIGPEDTPYANGCFFFDVTMGSDYPNQPPKVQFLTTSSFLNCYGSNIPVRFNPNLYECGKVCLSLLGTWSGPSWTPKESTLLQVLVSLQSLVLGAPKPYFNEPCYEEEEGTEYGESNSKLYNKDIRRKTIRVAMLPFLHNQLHVDCEEGDDMAAAAAKEGASTGGGGKKRKMSETKKQQRYWFPEFREVIEQHFNLKKQSIREQLRQWLQDDETLLDLYSKIWKAFDRLEDTGKQPHKQRQRRRQRHRQRAPSTYCKPDHLPFQMKDGVIMLDDNEDDDIELHQALKNSIDMTGTMQGFVSENRGKSNKDGGIIELLVDSDDDEECKGEDAMNRKPAAVVVATTASKGFGCNEIVDLT